MVSGEALDRAHETEEQIARARVALIESGWTEDQVEAALMLARRKAGFTDAVASASLFDGKPYVKCSGKCGKVKPASEMNTILTKRHRKRAICGGCLSS